MKRKNLSEKADKRRRAKVIIGYETSGEPVVKWAHGNTIKELENSIAEIKKTYIGGTEVQREVIFGSYAKDWYDTYKKPHLSASSRQNYSSAFNKHILPKFGDRQMKGITAMQLQSFLNSLDCGTSLMGDITSILKNTFAMATAQGVIDRDPAAALKKPKTEKESKRALTPEETKATLKLIESHSDGLLLALLYYTGLRRGEVLGLMWSDIDFVNMSLHVERDVDFATGHIGTCKTENSVRDVPIPDELLKMLKEERGIGYIIKAPRTGEHWAQSTYVRHWKAIQKDIEEITKQECVLTAHFYRHNYASLLYAAGVDVLSAQKFLGHADPSTTMRIYTHLSDSMQKEDAKKIDAAFKKNFLSLPNDCQNGGSKSRNALN